MAGLKRKSGSNSFSVKSKVKRTESNTSLNSVVCPSRSSSENNLKERAELEKRRKLRMDGSQSPGPVSVSDSETEPYLNSYPIQISSGSSYPQINVITEGSNSADWFNLPQPAPQPHVQRYQQMQPINSTYSMPSYGYHEANNYNADPSNYTHGICCNAITANYYQSRSYHQQSVTGQINNQNENSQQMDFPDPFCIGAGDFNAIDRGDFSDLIWYDIDDMPENTSTSEQGRQNNIHPTPVGQVSFVKDSFTSIEDEYQQHTQQQQQQHTQQCLQPQTPAPAPKASTCLTTWSNSVHSSETSSTFGSSEAYTSYEESSLTSCTSSDDGCYDEYDGCPSNDPTIGDAMAIITNSQKRRLSKSSLARNKKSMNMYVPDAQQNINEVEEKNIENTWLFREYDEDLVSGIVEAFS